jgi:hypothetical protein
MADRIRDLLDLDGGVPVRPRNTWLFSTHAGRSTAWASAVGHTGRDDRVSYSFFPVPTRTT